MFTMLSPDLFLERPIACVFTNHHFGQSRKQNGNQCDQPRHISKHLQCSTEHCCCWKWSGELQDLHSYCRLEENELLLTNLIPDPQQSEDSDERVVISIQGAWSPRLWPSPAEGIASLKLTNVLENSCPYRKHVFVCGKFWPETIRNWSGGRID